MTKSKEELGKQLYEVLWKAASKQSDPGLMRKELEKVKQLIKDGADVNYADPVDGRSLMHIAAENGWVDLMICLQTKGANIEAHEKDFGGTPLHRAAEKGKLEAVTWLIEKGGANIESKDSYGRTPLHCAVMKGQTHLNQKVGIVEYLIEHGADKYAQAKGDRNRTPADYARQYSHILANMLESQPTKEVVRDKRGYHSCIMI